MNKPEDDKNRPHEVENEATLQVLAEIMRWVRERPGWVMAPDTSGPVELLPPRGKNRTEN